MVIDLLFHSPMLSKESSQDTLPMGFKLQPQLVVDVMVVLA
jgi:hypothetical protein